MKLFVIGLGPGDEQMMTGKAKTALKEADCIVGYGVYIDLIRPLIEGKEILSTPMKQEVARCRMAVEAAISGKTVAMVSSGDAGIYGMAGLVYEVLADYPAAQVDVEVVPGITAATSAAAVLGAPLTHDFARTSKNGCGWRRRRDLCWQSTTRAAKNGLITCKKPAKLSRSICRPKPPVALSATSGGKVRSR